MFYLLTGLSLLSSIECHDSQYDITTTTGTYRGELIPLRRNNIIKFQAVRYAEPPVESLRFKPPQPLKETVQPIMPNKLSTCYQPKPSVQNGKKKNIEDSMSEDCLYLNIYTPAAINKGNIYSTIVWIPGDSIYEGSIAADSTNPEYLVSKENVIVIQVQYRMGSFGFLSLENTNIKGNMGLLDQVAALKWIKHNIDKFSGISTNITLMGYGVGAAMIGLHMMSEISIGLFQKVIIHSGSPYEENFFHNSHKSHQVSAKISNYIGCKPFDTDVERCLMNTRASALVAADSAIPELAPNQDGYFLSISLAIPVIKNKFPDIPILASFVQNEGMKKLLILLKSEREINYNSFSQENYKSFLKKLIEFSQSEKAITTMSDFYIEQYTQNGITDYKGVASQLLGDYSTTCFAHEFLRYASFRGKNLYLYTFNHRSTIDTSPTYTEVTHGSDIPYLFGTMFSEDIAGNYKGMDRDISERIMHILGEFSRTGNPGKDWLKYDKDFEMEIKDSQDKTLCKRKKLFCEKWWRFRKQI